MSRNASGAILMMVVILFADKGTSLFAQTPPASSSQPAGGGKGAASKNQGEKKKSLSFEDELVEGATAKPELFYLFQKKNFNYKRLIKLRENFIPEMRRTSEEVQRGKSSN